MQHFGDTKHIGKAVAEAIASESKAPLNSENSFCCSIASKAYAVIRFLRRSKGPSPIRQPNLDVS